MNTPNAVHTQESTGPKRKLSLRETAIVKACWIINKDERNQLDKFFLVQDTWDKVEKDLVFDRVEYKIYLSHEGQEYEVILCSPNRILAASTEVGLSFRVNYLTGLKVVLIKEWKASAA